jgi:putative tricarboxylic transport membrane protein
VPSSAWLDGLLIALQPTNLLYLLLGHLVGLVVGVLPAVGPPFAVALALPLTFGMDPTAALIFLCAIHATCAYGDSVTSILVNTPGSAVSVPSCWDGFPLTRQGRGGLALGIAAAGSFAGGVTGWLCLMIVARPMTRLAIEIGAPEYFALALVALSLVTVAWDSEPTKGVLWACLGMGISFIGRDPISGLTSRLSLGVTWLEGGVSVIVSALGLFAMAQVVSLLGGGPGVVAVQGARDSVAAGAQEVLRRPWTLLRSSAVGVLIGVLPALGASLASVAGYLVERRVSSERAQFGRGAPAGLMAAEVSKGACVVGDLIPTFTLGVPGSVTAALLMGALTIHGLDAGPRFMLSGTMPSAVFAGILLTQAAVLVTGMTLARSLARVATVPSALLAPGIAALCFVGAYAERSAIFDVGLTIGFGVLGFLSRRARYPVVALLLGLLLGPLVEVNFHRSLGVGLGSYAVFVGRPLAASLLALTAAVLASSLVGALWRRSGGGDALRLPSAEREPRRPGAELTVLAGALSVFGLLLAEARHLDAASAAFPRMVSAAGVLLAAYRVGVVALRRASLPAAEEERGRTPALAPWLVFCGLGAYAAAWALAGFAVATALYVLGTAWAAGYRRVEVALAASVLWSGGLALLAWMAGVALLPGVLADLVP